MEGQTTLIEKLMYLKEFFEYTKEAMVRHRSLK